MIPSSFGVTSRYFLTGSSAARLVCNTRTVMTNKMRCIRSLDVLPGGIPVAISRRGGSGIAWGAAWVLLTSDHPWHHGAGR
jgi:hypothetical protein